MQRNLVDYENAEKSINISVDEKHNDLLVSQRQKHNGMSWSKSGSLALAAIKALVRNNEYQKWFRTRELDFKFAT